MLIKHLLLTSQFILWWGIMRRKKIAKIRKRSKRKLSAHRYKKHHRHIYVFVILSLTLAFLLLMSLLIKNTLFASKYKIENITYHPQSVEIYDDPHIYKAVTESFLDKNYYRTKWFLIDDIKKQIQSDYPIVQDIQMILSQEQTIQIILSFHTPTLVFRTPSQRVATYQDQLYPLVSGNLLGSWSMHIDLPKYSSWFDNLDGILYHISAETLQTITASIYNTLWEKYITDFIYLPWGKLFFITYKGKQVYINLEQSIDAQLMKLIDLENRDPNFSEIYKIDVGSSDDIFVK